MNLSADVIYFSFINKIENKLFVIFSVLFQMCAKTTVFTDSSLKENKFWLNGVEEPFYNSRLQNCLKECKLKFICNIFLLN